MKREILLHRELDHPHIIKLYDHMEDSENVYLVLEFANRGSLFYEIRRQKRLNEEKARSYFRQTCEGVQYLHENDIIHRDIKPENILLDSSGNLKICDFGWCAKGTETRTTFCGTLDYMAPEMVMGGGHTFSVDLWALGVLLYELVHGTAPFSARKEAEKCQQILGVTYTLDPTLSTDLKELISSLLKSAPEDRISLSQVLAHPWLVGRTKEESLMGVTMKNYVKGYGMAEGVVTAVTGDVCTVFYQVPNITEKLPSSRVAKIVKRKNGLQKPSEPKDDDTQASTPAIPQSPIEESALLDKIEQWCKAPSKVPIKKDKFMEVLEESNKKFEESLQLLKPKQKNGLESDPSAGLKVEITAVEKLNPPSIPVFDDETPGEQQDTKGKAKAEIETGEIIAEEDEDKPKKKGKKWVVVNPGVFSRHVSPQQERGRALGLQIEVDQSEADSPKLPPQPSDPSPVESPKPVFSPIESRSVSEVSEHKEERETAGFSPAGSQTGRMFDFEYERQLIEEKNQMFYAQTEEKWMNRQSQESVVKAPDIKTKAPRDAVPNSLIEEIERLANATKRGPDDTHMRMQALEQANTALQHRKNQLEALLKEIEAPIALPKIKKPVDPQQLEEKGGFLRWIGSMIGCGDRPR